jgi:hypothetical protein
MAIMSRVILGIEKLEKDADPKRNCDLSLGFHYDFNRSTALGMGEAVLEKMGITVGKAEKALALLIDRGRDGRNI